jgi:hypothetical protein
MTETPQEQTPEQASLEEADLGDDREVIPGTDADHPDAPHAPGDGQDPGGADTQLAAEKD